MWQAARRDLLTSLFAEVVGAAALAGVLLFGRQLVLDLTSEPGVARLGDVLPETIGLGASLIVSGLAAVVVRQARWLVSEEVTRHVEEEIIATSTAVPYQLFEEAGFHDQLTRSNSQASQSSYQLVYDVLDLANVAATSIVVVVVLVTSVPEVLAALLLIAVPAVAAARVSARLAYETTYQLTPDDRLRRYLYGALTTKAAAREVRLFGLADMLRQRWERLYGVRLGRVRRLIVRQVLFNGAAAVISALLVAGVLLVLVQAAVDGRITLADAAVAIVALQQLTARIRSAATASGSLRQSTLFIDDFQRFQARRPRAGGRAELPRSAPAFTGGPVEVDSVSFRYPGTDRQVLRDVSLSIRPGEIVALVGVSGSGKTTLAHLVAGLYEPTAGRITVGGSDIADVARPGYWTSVAAVFQDFVRYELTARENIAMSDHARLDDTAAVAAAARLAGIHERLEELPAGYETMLSRAYEDGADLSLGQWQRLAVARAFFRDAPLLVLDEPASAVDAIAEHQLYEKLLELCQGRSVLLISHRFSTVRMAHRICVLEHGTITEEGTHAELLARGGLYAELFHVQARGFLDTVAPEPAQDRR